MAMSCIWTGMVVLSLVFALWTGQGAALSAAAVAGAQSGVTLVISIAGAVCLWSALGSAAERAGLTGSLARFMQPVVGKLFPCTRRDSTAGQLICSNICANLLGLGNAATPMGVAAVQRMRQYAPPGTASNEMCRLIVMNTASIQLIPANVAAVRAALGCAAPFDLLPAVWVTSLCSVSAGLLAAVLMEKAYARA